MRTVRTYYIDRPLTAEEILIVEQAMDNEVEQVKIPYVVPAADLERDFADDIRAGATSLAPILCKAGIDADAGRQVALVVPKDQDLHLMLGTAIYEATGFRPYTIQTAEQREHIGNPGDLRIMNTHRIMGFV